MGRALRNQRGQMTIELVLVLAILTGLAIVISREARDRQLLATIIEGPWLPLQGMIEDGVWVKAGASKEFHPGALGRHGTIVGEVP